MNIRIFLLGFLILTSCVSVDKISLPACDERVYGNVAVVVEVINFHLGSESKFTESSYYALAFPKQLVATLRETSGLKFKNALALEEVRRGKDGTFHSRRGEGRLHVLSIVLGGRQEDVGERIVVVLDYTSLDSSEEWTYKLRREGAGWKVVKRELTAIS